MRFALVCLAVLIANPANALSCMRPDAVRLFEEARDAETAFYIVKGEVEFLEPPNTPPRNAKTPATTRARITGLALSKSGFNAPFDERVTLKASCLGPWCGAPEMVEGSRLMAVEIGLADLSLYIGPCGGDQMAWDEQAEDRLLSCHLQGICEAAEF
ncbi:MAG: hypothetical protein AAF718_00445 [Pseudomonadota bacterium]